MALKLVLFINGKRTSAEYEFSTHGSVVEGICNPREFADSDNFEHEYKIMWVDDLDE